MSAATTDNNSGEHCCICYEPMQYRATIVGCGHNQYCLACIGEWFEKHDSCPLCRRDAIAVRYPCPREWPTEAVMAATADLLVQWPYLLNTNYAGARLAASLGEPYGMRRLMEHYQQQVALMWPENVAVVNEAESNAFMAGTRAEREERYRGVTWCLRARCMALEATLDIIGRELATLITNMG